MNNTEKLLYPIEKVTSVESQANSQENESLLLFSRLNNPTIKQQILDLMNNAEQHRAQLPDIKPVYDEFGNPVIDLNGKLLTKDSGERLAAKTPNQIREEYNNNLLRIETDTPIDFGKGSSHCSSFNGLGREKVNINYSNKTSGEKLTARQQSLVEAHEKGHAIRRYYENGYSYFKNHFLKAVDLSKINVTEQDLEHKKQSFVLNSNEDMSSEPINSIVELKENVIDYLSEPHEIAERMSQLKNYFGFKGTEKFTVEHLQYAKKHYVEDIGFDNDMKHFFEAIPKEKEEVFCEILNNSGI